MRAPSDPRHTTYQILADNLHRAISGVAAGAGMGAVDDLISAWDGIAEDCYRPDRRILRRWIKRLEGVRAGG